MGSPVTGTMTGIIMAIVVIVHEIILTGQMPTMVPTAFWLSGSNRKKFYLQFLYYDTPNDTQRMGQ